MTNPLKHSFIQELDTVDDYSHELLEICYAHGCVWLSTQSASSKEELGSAVRYEFDFASAEMAYLTAKRIVELLEKEIPGIAEASDAISERKYS
jgi:hypothetical protein